MPPRLLDASLASGENILDSADLQLVAASSPQSGKRGRHWLDLPEDDDAGPQKLLSEDSARHPDVVADLPVAVGPSSGTISDTTIHDRISPWRPSSGHVDSSRDCTRAPAASPRAPRFTAVPSSVLELSDRMLRPGSNTLAVLSRTLIAGPGGFDRPDGLRSSGPSPNLPFPSDSDYLPRFLD